jgi:hypothetical protein
MRSVMAVDVLSSAGGRVTGVPQMYRPDRGALLEALVLHTPFAVMQLSSPSAPLHKKPQGAATVEERAIVSSRIL